MRVVCRTNIDKYKGLEWPVEMCTPPRCGDYVEARSGTRLVIVEIVHKMDFPCGHPGGTPGPYLEIELHTPDGRIPR